MNEPFILFKLADTTYGISSHYVQQMEMLEQITPVPNAPPFVKGVVYSRGQVIPAIALRLRFGVPEIAYDLRTRLIVLQSHQRHVGLIVDSAREFVLLPTELMQEPPEQISSMGEQYLAGIITLNERVILILDIEALLTLTPEQEMIPYAPEKSASC